MLLKPIKNPRTVDVAFLVIIVFIAATVAAGGGGGVGGRPRPRNPVKKGPPPVYRENYRDHKPLFMRSAFLAFLFWVKDLRVLSSKNSFSMSSSIGSNPGSMD